jgi:hypothetical protein
LYTFLPLVLIYRDFFLFSRIGGLKMQRTSIETISSRPHNLKRRNTIKAGVILTLLVGIHSSWSMPAFAQSSGPSSSNVTFKLESLRANVQQQHPERGVVKLNELRTIGTNLPNLALNRYLSIFVSDVDTVNEIKFSEVMDKLVSQSGDSLLTKQILFHQWWDTAGQRPGLGLGPHCDDDTAPTPASGISTFTSLSTLNSFPYRCPRLEAGEALSDPFGNEVETNPNAYSAIAFSNRFDLVSPPDDCGEYRIVFARNSGRQDPINRNLIIFEARVPNPKPSDGLNGCRPILEFWHGLSDTSLSAVERGRRLHDFYLNGLPGSNVGPIVDVSHYTFGTGQIRSNQFMLNDPDIRLPTAPFDWTLREFKTFLNNGTLAIIPDSVKTNPGNRLFVAGSNDVRIATLNQDIRTQMKNILGAAGPGNGVDDVNSIGFQTTGQGVNSFESDESHADLGDVVVAYISAPGGKENPIIQSNIAASLTLLHSPLTALNVVNRLRTQTCAGCHEFSNDDHQLGGKAIWPNKTDGDATHPKMRFTQASEKASDLQPAIVGGGKRYAISLTVECLLDFREVFMKKALGLTPASSADHCPKQ